jgi:hypothetical protein
VVGGAEAAAGALALVQEVQAGHQEGEHGGRPVHPRRKGRRGPRLVVILQEANGPALEVRIRVEMAAHGLGVPGVQAVVQPLVVGVMEPLLLERPLEIPVRLGHEHEVWPRPVHVGDRLGPERLVDGRGPIGGPGALTPRSRDDVGQHEHGHATHAVALAGDRGEDIRMVAVWWR